MSTRRVREEAGWAGGKLPKGPAGRNLCRWCKEEVPAPRRTFCSAACVHEHRLRSNPGYVRAQVFARDKGICNSCGQDTEANRKKYGPRYSSASANVERRIKAMVPQPVRGVDYVPGDWRVFDKYWRKVQSLTRRRMETWCRRVGVSPPIGHLWEADHIVPVVEGGGECGLENYRTLCLACHRTATKELAGRRAASRRAQTQVAGVVPGDVS